MHRYEFKILWCSHLKKLRKFIIKCKPYISRIYVKEVESLFYSLRFSSHNQLTIFFAIILLSPAIKFKSYNESSTLTM